MGVMLVLILIVEDDLNKAKEIETFLDAFGYDCQVEHQISLVGGLRCAKEIKPDIVLLDMTLPNFKGPTNDRSNRMIPFGGVEFIRQIERNNLKSKIIVITQFESFGEPPQVTLLADIDSDLKSKYPKTYCGAVYYHASQSSWERQLSKFLDEAKGGLK